MRVISDKEIERLRMRARMFDAFIRGGRGIKKEHLKEYNDILKTLGDLRIKVFDE